MMLALSGFLTPALALAADSPDLLDLGKTERFNLDMVIRSIPASASGYTLRQNELARRSWKHSLIPMVAAQGLDVASSYGMRELNPMLAGSDERFGAKAATIKAGTTAAVAGIEYLIVKKWPGAARTFAKLNWGSSLLTGAFAAHNFAIR